MVAKATTPEKVDLRSDRYARNNRDAPIARSCLMRKSRKWQTRNNRDILFHGNGPHTFTSNANNSGSSRFSSTQLNG